MLKVIVVAAALAATGCGAEDGCEVHDYSCTDSCRPGVVVATFTASICRDGEIRAFEVRVLEPLNAPCAPLCEIVR